MTTEFTLDDDQEEAAQLILHAPFGVVTGGPGVGKTTTLRIALNRILGGRTVATRYVLLAPTGKAARRITEATGEEAFTIHRWLITKTQAGDDWIPPDLVIVDEASMLSATLAAWLFNSIPSTTRVVLVGDADQLPSVGAGRVLADILQCERIPAVHLKTVHRSARGSWVCDNAYRIIEGTELDLKKRADFMYVRLHENVDAAREQVVRRVGIMLKEHDTVQVLGPYNKYGLGVDLLNVGLKARINPQEDGADTFRIYRDDTYYDLTAGDRIIYTANDYKLGVFNGQEGVVKAVAPDTVTVDFEGTVLSLDAVQAMKLRLAYALTIHKSQGSEWDWVVVICHDAHKYMLSRQILYTAVTRAKRGVVLMGNEEGIHQALTNNDPQERMTTLYHRLEQG